MAIRAPYGPLQSPAKASGVFQRATLPYQSTTAVGSNGDPPQLVAVHVLTAGSREQWETKR